MTVLASYQAEPDKWRVETDYFEGRLSVVDAYYSSLDVESRERAYIDVQFGYRTTLDGALSLAAYLPAHQCLAPEHERRWRGFERDDSRWLALETDARFALWLRRYLDGDWDVDDGPARQLNEQVRLLNGLTVEMCGQRLLVPGVPLVVYPGAQNTHAYQDSHRELYRYLIDGLNKECLAALAQRWGIEIKASPDKTVKVMRALLAGWPEAAEFFAALEVVSSKRRPSAHGVREPAQPVDAFGLFTKDLERCVGAFSLLVQAFEREFDMDAPKAAARVDALSPLAENSGRSDSVDLGVK